MTAVKQLFRKKSSYDVNMSEGSIVGHLLTFAFPLLLGNLFQQLYNMVDTWVVGNFVGSAAFSAVGTVGPIINTLIGFFVGLSSGAGVVISQYYGAGKNDGVKKTVHTAYAVTLIMGVAFTVIGMLMTPLSLKMMNTPASVMPSSKTYLLIYFAGIIFMMVYNIGSGILRAVGDSRRPFYFLVVSAITNTGLDLLFVLAFDMGVAGVALATVIAQALSAVLVTLALIKSKGSVRLEPPALRIHTSELARIVRVGIPAGLQMAVTSFSNVFVQSYINHFGKDCMAGWTAYAKIDQLLFLPMQSLSLAATTFVGQNLGAKQVKRAEKGVLYAIGISVAITLVLILPVELFASELVSFFNGEAAVITYGARFLRWLSPFYVLCCVNQICAGALRGSGNSRAPMFIMLGSFVLFRQAYLFVMANYVSNTIIPISMSYPAGWLLCSVLMFLYYKFVGLSKSKLIDH